jgi:hypothetical protein
MTYVLRLQKCERNGYFDPIMFYLLPHMMGKIQRGTIHRWNERLCDVSLLTSGLTDRFVSPKGERP